MSKIVYGPQACGKTRNAKALAAYFGLRRIVDDWMPGDEVPPDALVLTGADMSGTAGAVAYADAAAAAVHEIAALAPRSARGTDGSGRPAGLMYRRTDGVEVLSEGGEQWLVTLLPEGGAHLRRYMHGMQDETYYTMTDGEAAAAIVGVIFGYPPPRARPGRDRPAR